MGTLSTLITQPWNQARGYAILTTTTRKAASYKLW